MTSFGTWPSAKTTKDLVSITDHLDGNWGHLRLFRTGSWLDKDNSLVEELCMRCESFCFGFFERTTRLLKKAKSEKNNMTKEEQDDLLQYLKKLRLVTKASSTLPWNSFDSLLVFAGETPWPLGGCEDCSNNGFVWGYERYERYIRIFLKLFQVGDIALAKNEESRVHLQSYTEHWLAKLAKTSIAKKTQ